MNNNQELRRIRQQLNRANGVKDVPHQPIVNKIIATMLIGGVVAVVGFMAFCVSVIG